MRRRQILLILFILIDFNNRNVWTSNTLSLSAKFDMHNRILKEKDEMLRLIEDMLKP